MLEICQRRVENGWYSGEKLDCSFPCLASGIEQDTLGQYWLVQLPNSVHICHIVDVGAIEDLPRLRERGEVIELPYWIGEEYGSYIENVKVWRIK